MTLNTQSLDPLIAQGGDNLPWINIDFFCSGAAVKNQVNWVYNQNVASFKGVPFAVIQDNRSGGRRIHVHEYPARETWDNEDMGRLRQQIDVSAFVYGDKCESWAETLFAYCTDPQIGVLTLPFRPASGFPDAVHH